MTLASPPVPRRRPGTGTLVGFAALFAVGAGLAAWFDWTYWEGYNQLAYVLVAPVVVGVGLVLFLVRRLPTLLRFGTLALAAGLVTGAVLGPSRPALISHDAAIAIRLSSPVSTEVTGRGSCSTVETGDQFSLYLDSDPRVGEGVEELAIGLFVSHGDMLGDPGGRSDGLALQVTLLRTQVPIAEDGSPSETRMVSDASSDLEADVEGLEGHLTFDGLVVAPPESGFSQEPIDVAGTIEWVCQP